MLLVDEDGKAVFTNRSAEEIFAADHDELLQLHVSDLIPHALRKGHDKLIAQYLQNPCAVRMGKSREVVALRRDGKEITIEAGLSPIKINNERYVLVSIIDVSDRVKLRELEIINKELELAATRDVLTGLPNRRLMFKLIENQKNLAIRSGSKITIMFVDLDGFKRVNDEHGHNIGDALLCEVAKRLGAQIRKSDVLGRLAGDEFLMCFTDLGSELDIRLMADHLLDIIADIDEVKGVPLHISASIGAYSVDVNASSHIEELVKRADQLMYEAKKCGKGRAVVKEAGQMSDNA